MPPELSTTLSTKGQMVVPKAIREEHGWGPGTRLVVESTPAGMVVRKDESKPVFPPTRHEDVFGCLYRPGQRALTIEEMDEAITKGVKRRRALGRY